MFTHSAASQAFESPSPLIAKSSHRLTVMLGDAVSSADNHVLLQSRHAIPIAIPVMLGTHAGRGFWVYRNKINAWILWYGERGNHSYR